MKNTYQLKKVFIYLLPLLICFSISFVIPFLSGIFLSFFEWSTTIEKIKFVGINNYITAFKDINFLNSFVFTIKFSILSVITVNIIAYLLALILTSAIPLKNIFRTIIFMPNLIGGVILGFIWQILLNAIFYNFNTSIGSDENLGFLGLILITNWQLVGYMMIIYIASINNVNKDLIDASKIDGCNYFNRLINVIIPSTMNAITICLFLTINNTFKMYDANLALTNGGPNRRTEMLSLNIIYTIFKERKPGVGISKGVIFFIIIGLISIIQVKTTRKREIEY